MKLKVKIINLKRKRLVVVDAFPVVE